MTEEDFYQAVNNLWLNSEPDKDGEFLRCIDLNAEKNKEHLKGLLFLRPVQPDAQEEKDEWSAEDTLKLFNEWIKNNDDWKVISEKLKDKTEVQTET